MLIKEGLIASQESSGSLILTVFSSLKMTKNSVFNLPSTFNVRSVFPMVVVSILPHAEFGPNDIREDAPYFLSSPV